MLILKVFGKQEDTRGIDNYLMLTKLGIPTLPLLGYTKNAILLPDVDAHSDYRLGKVLPPCLDRQSVRKDDTRQQIAGYYYAKLLNPEP